MNNFDFLSYKTILKYIISATLILIAGSFLKDIIAILFVLTILHFCFTRNLYRVIITFFMWYLLSGFFVGQGYIKNEFVINYISKPSFLVFLIFLFFFEKIPKNALNAKYLNIWLSFLLLICLSSVIQGQSPFVIVTISTFFICYLVIQARGISLIQYQNLLNLFVAIAVIQTGVSFLQVSELIPPPSRLMDDGSGSQVEWLAGLDDAASGTFGAGASHITSWYASLISFFMLVKWVSTKNKNYLLFMVLSLLQFTMGDSKTIMGVTVLMLICYLLYLFKNNRKFKLNIMKNSLLIFVFCVISFGFYHAWNLYYEYYGNKTNSSSINLGSVYKNQAEKTADLIIENAGDWGKIRGFQYVFEDFVQHNPIQIIWGYGIQGYSFNGKQGVILNKDTHLMQLNNLSNSNSGLITLFAVTGLIGFILFFATLISWFKKNHKTVKNNFDLIANTVLIFYLPFSLLAAFLYSVSLTSIPIVLSATIISIYKKQSSIISNKHDS